MIGRLFASFFGAAMIAGAFAYYNYKFSQFKFIDFTEFITYTKKDIFSPKEEKYLVIIYNSKDELSSEKLKKIKSNSPIILLDYYQVINDFSIGDSNITSIKAGTETFLRIVHRFNIYNLPSLFFIKKVKDNLYKQDSDVYNLNNFEFEE
jgi:hypothetical protein